MIAKDQIEKTNTYVAFAKSESSVSDPAEYCAVLLAMATNACLLSGSPNLERLGLAVVDSVNSWVRANGHLPMAVTTAIKSS